MPAIELPAKHMEALRTLALRPGGWSVEPVMPWSVFSALRERGFVKLIDYPGQVSAPTLLPRVYAVTPNGAKWARRLDVSTPTMPCIMREYVVVRHGAKGEQLAVIAGGTRTFKYRVRKWRANGRVWTRPVTLSSNAQILRSATEQDIRRFKPDPVV